MPVSDAELAAGLSRALGRPVVLQARRPWPYQSSLPMEELRVDGSWLLFKDASPRRRRARPRFLIDPMREIAVYREVLPGLDAPALLGALVEHGRVWLFLERIDGVPLAEASRLEAWEAAARWLARLHARPLPAAPARLVRYDAAWLGRWPARARDLTGGAVLARAAGPIARAVQRVAAWPSNLIHGEFYPSNVLVQGSRIRPVDWETAGIGAGLLDIGALTSGAWRAEERDRLEESYRTALPRRLRPSADDLADALRHCRLLLAVQWLGWTADYAPPAAHAHDWLGDVARLAEEIDR